MPAITRSPRLAVALDGRLQFLGAQPADGDPAQGGGVCLG